MDFRAALLAIPSFLPHCFFAPAATDSKQVLILSLTPPKLFFSSPLSRAFAVLGHSLDNADSGLADLLTRKLKEFHRAVDHLLALQRFNAVNSQDTPFSAFSCCSQKNDSSSEEGLKATLTR